jgi:ferredoxin-NADP reductase
LWRPESEILNSAVSFKVGGNFVYPPPTLDRESCARISRAVFIAGGVGINPIMSMISAMHELGANKLGGMVKTVRILYSARPARDTETREDEEVLFARRLESIADAWQGHEQVDLRYTFFNTGKRSEEKEGSRLDGPGIQQTYYRRIQREDLVEALGPENGREHTVVYVCGLPNMTDDFVDWLKRAPGMDEKSVLCEKWW